MTEKRERLAFRPSGPVRAALEELHTLTQTPGYHWINHFLENGLVGNGHRAEDNAIPGFDLISPDAKGAAN